MDVCLICEGSYPYIRGGVSGWVHTLLCEFPDINFTIFSIATNPTDMGEYRYELPQNVTKVITYYISENSLGKGKKNIRLSPHTQQVLRDLLTAPPESIDWNESLSFLQQYRDQMDSILMGKHFYSIALDLYLQEGFKMSFNDYLWNLRGMYFPFFSTLSANIPKVDLFHAVSTGYAGMVGAAFSYAQKVPFLLSEHGIYTREREEDIIKSDWLSGEYKGLWIDFFKKMSLIAYEQANVVTTLFENNRELQVELGCPPEKLQVIPNGIDVHAMSASLPRTEESKKYFNIGAILRIVPIKDVKTMLIGYMIAKEKEPSLRLNILGNYDEAPEYYQECVGLVQNLAIEDVIFYGQVNIKEHIRNFDLLLLTSISEGQPLVILEGFSIGIPYICTNVGDCRNLLEGNPGDNLGTAGFIVPIMNTEALANKILYCAHHPAELKEMGSIGKVRTERYYKISDCYDRFRALYNALTEEY